MVSDELIANLFRISQTEQKLKRDNVKGEVNANDVHYEVGKKIRNTIKELGGIMPEDYPTPEKSLKVLEKEKDFKQANLNLPFIADLSIKLGYYGLLNKIVLDKNKMVDILWK